MKKRYNNIFENCNFAFGELDKMLERFEQKSDPHYGFVIANGRTSFPPDTISHCITNLCKDYVEIETTKTPWGKLSAKMIDEDAPQKFQPRILFRKNDDGEMKDCELLTINVVYEP